MKTIDNSQIHLHLSSSRGVNELTSGTSFHTFDPNNNQHSRSFKDIEKWHDLIMYPGKTQAFEIKAKSSVVIIPLVGQLKCHFNQQDLEIQVEQILNLCFKEAQELRIENPYQENAINFLFIELKTICAPGHSIVNFKLGHNNLRVIPLKKGKLHIGEFEGRQEDEIYFSEPSDLLIFIVQGVFEVQERLLETRDVLSLTDVSKLEFEALSHNGVILIAEL